MNNDHSPSPASVSLSSTPALFRKSWKIWIGALIGTLIANILCLPLWTDYDVMGFIRTPFNSEAHMEIMYTGTLTGADPFAITSSEPSLNTSTNFSYGKGAQFYRVNLPIAGEWKSYSFTLKSRKKGRILIGLKGPPVRNDYGEIYSIFVDWKNLKINNKEIFSDRRKVSHTKCFAHQIPVNENDIIRISFDVRRHYFDADDFNLRKTKNYWYIVTLSILSFVISCIMWQCITASYKHRKAEDAVFVIIFFVLLAIPLSNVSDAQKAIREGRKLRQRPNIALVLKGGANFGKAYDDWFCDHLGGREWLIKLHDIMQGKTQRIIRGQRAWYMQDSGWLFDNLECRLSLKDLNPAIKALVGLRKFCELNHIKLYVFMVPRKESVYQEHLYGYGMDRERSAEEKNFHEQMKHLTKKQHVPYIYPWAELRDACRQDYTFFKLTHHWTDWGAYIGYKALMEEIRRDLPDMPVVSLGDYYRTQSELIRDDWCRDFSHDGNLGKYFNFETDQRCPAATYNYYDNKNAGKLVLNVGRYTKDFRYGGGAYKIMVIGSSQNENLMNFLPYSAAQTKYIRLNMGQLPGSEIWKIMKYYEKDILSYKPDVLILSLLATDDHLLNIQNIFRK